MQIFEDDKQKFLPEGVGKEIKDGKEYLHIVHTDEVGDRLHIVYIRPIRLTIADSIFIHLIIKQLLLSIMKQDH